MKKILLLITLVLSLYAEDIIVFNNEYHVLKLEKKVKKLIIGNRDMINVSLLNASSESGTLLKIFGKKSGNTSILIVFRDGSMNNHHVYVNENLGFIQKMINIIEPELKLSKVGDGSTVISGSFKNPHDKKRIYSLLKSAGIDMSKLMDLTQTEQVNKMVRTKLYLVEINNQKAKDLGGVTGLGFFSKYIGLSVNPAAANGATFSGWLLDNAGGFSATEGNSVQGTLNFLEESGIGKIVDDTVLMTTEDENASFRVGGEVYIPIGLTQNIGFAPTIQLEEREYGLHLILTSQFMEKDGYLHIDIDIKDSQFDTNKDHDVQLGEHTVVPSFVSKNIQTNVVVKSGQVIVLGGRLHTEDIDKEEKVPLIGDIPLLGELFKHTVKGTKSNDLLFFLVPEIVDANEEIDDTHFYREFKNSSDVLHESILDMNSTKEEKKSLVVLNDTPQTAEVLEVEEDEVMVIELEDNSASSLAEEKSQVIEVQAKASATKYAVLSEKIFLRDSPLNGKRTKVWKKGHAFTSDETKSVNGTRWLKIKENCYSKCTEASEELWISKKYVELL